MVSLTAAQLDDLCEAAQDSIRFDGLCVEPVDPASDGEPAGPYRFEADATTGSGLDEGALREIAGRESAYVANWYFWRRVVDATAAGREFLRWLEHAASGTESEVDGLAVPERHDRLADGIDREWGQLLITTSLCPDGRRRYCLRHVDDGGGVNQSDAGPGEAGDSLDVLENPRELAERITVDDRGRYRPLKTAPSLPTGWRLDDLDWSALLEAVGDVYPATVENWYREREGALDVEHFRETAERQTGIYDVVDELPREGLEWVSEACCVDSQCLKRRAWDEAPGDELDVPRGEGEFPCREPCSLLIAAAREWTLLEREEPRTYEFELTPSEKAQLEDVVDAVAEGRTEAIREADLSEGANRYRVRYLRAKRFDDGGFPGGTDADRTEGTPEEEAGTTDDAWWWRPW